VAWYVLGAAGCLSPILYSTINIIVKDDAEERALIMVSFHPQSGIKRYFILIASPRDIGFHDDLWVLFQHLGSIAGLSYSRARRCPKMAKGLACIIRFLFPSMGRLYRIYPNMAKVRTHLQRMIDFPLT
jgi:hypothetical protein